MAVSKKRKIKEEERVDKKILSHDEHIIVATKPLEIENAKLLMAVEEQSLANMLLELRLLENKIEKQRLKIHSCEVKYSNEKKIYTASIGAIMKNHNLESEKFSYNNNTGEIIL